MSDNTKLTVEAAQELAVESHAPYLKVWVALLVLTIVEFFYAMIFKDAFPLLVSGLVGMALMKAGLVGWYFMHLKFERRWVYLIIIPAFVFAIFLTLSLYPDMAMKPVEESEISEGQVSTDRGPGWDAVNITVVRNA